MLAVCLSSTDHVTAAAAALNHRSVILADLSQATDPSYPQSTTAVTASMCDGWQTHQLDSRRLNTSSRVLHGFEQLLSIDSMHNTATAIQEANVTLLTYFLALVT